MKKLLVSFAAIAALISCVKETPLSDNAPVSQEQMVSITAVGPGISDPNAVSQQNSQSTKTQLVDGTNVQWTPGDKIKMCFDVRTWVSNNVWTGVQFENIGESVLSLQYLQEV